MIYSDRNGVLELNPVTGSIRKTNLIRSNISPNGRFCMNETEEDEEAVLYHTENNAEIEIKAPDTDSFSYGLLFSHLAWAVVENKTFAYVMDYPDLYCIDCSTGQMYQVIPPSPEIDPIRDLVGFRDGRPVWAKVTGDKAELFYY